MIIDKKINIDVKCRFFAQYWGQKVAKETNYPNSPTINTSTALILNELENYHLELKPLSKITEEDAFEVASIISNSIHDSKSKELVSYYKEDILKDPEVLCHASYTTVDYVRSRGYALPFMEYSLEDLISLGWVRFIDNNF